MEKSMENTSFKMRCENNNRTQKKSEKGTFVEK